MATRDTAAPSFAQERFWFLDQLVPGNAAHTLSRSYLLDGELAPAALAAAVRAAAIRHPVLRARYAVDGDEISLRTAPVGTVVLDQLDLTTEPDPDARARQLVEHAAYTTFDLLGGPLFQARLARLDESRYLLVIAAHRSVFDGSSFEILERELAAGYELALRGRPDHRALPPLSYADHAREQRARATADDDLAFWRLQLDGAPAAVDLPTDHLRPPVPSYQAGYVSFEVSAGVVHGLRELGVPANTAALAAFADLLARYSTAREVVIGLHSTGRTGSELADLIGCLDTHVPIRVDVSAGTAGELAGRVDRAVRAALAHRDVPFDRIATGLDHARDLSRHPIFQVGFDYAGPAAEPVLDGLEIRRQTGDLPGWTRVDLELELTETADGGLTGRLGYATDLFEPATAARLARHYVALLTGFGTPAAVLSDVDILAADERRLMFDTWNPVDPDLASDKTFPELFEARVRWTPSSVAVSFGTDRLTYAQLNSRANRLARYLAEAGVRPETIVGLSLRRGLPLVTAVLAILKASGAYLPLDPQNPAARNEFLLADAAAGLVVTESALAAGLSTAHGTRVLVLEDIAADVDALPATDLPPRASPDNMIYVIYTSGSTGRPKGVVMTHRPLTNLLGWQVRRTPVTGPTLQFSSIGFDISFQEMFATWLAGGELVLLGEDDRRDPDRMLAVMRRAGVRRLYCPPMVLEQLAHVRTRDVPRLAEIITAGEALQLTPDVRRLLAGLDGVVLDNQYGPTEAHVITGHRLIGDQDRWPVRPPVGATVTNVRVYVLDRHQRPVPIGGSGEVYVGGVCLARGYLGRPGLTAERFLPDPYADQPGARLYRTGDLGRWLPDGTLSFLGRVDQQVKIRGYRVEPGEIEVALTAHPSVEDAAVLPVERDGDRRLAAYLVLAPGAEVTAAGLRNRLKEALPDYMVPTYFVPVDRIPLTAVGKIDRTGLPDPAASTLDSTKSRATGGRAAAGGLEGRLTRIWCDVIGLDRIGSDDSFFEIGGHSLLATKVVERIRAELSIEVSVRMVFEHSTVARLSALLDTRVGTGLAARAAAVPRRADLGSAPLAPNQHGLWLLHQIHPDCPAYHMPLCFELDGPLDAGALDRALTMLVERHETLRTALVAGGGEPRQLIGAPAPVEVPVVDLRALPATDRDDALRARLAAAVRAPFDLTRPPLWRAVRYVLDKDRHMLLLVLHHLITDGWSMEVLKRDLSTAYCSVRTGGKPDWPDLPVQFADLAEWATGADARAAVGRDLVYWRDTLDATCPPLRLPGYAQRPAPGFTAESVSGRLRGDTVRAVREVAQQANASPFSVLFAAFALVLGGYSGQREFHVGFPLGVRDAGVDDNVVGFFTNTLVLRCDVGTGRFLDLVRRTHQRVVEALAHPHVPFDVLVAELAPDRQADRNPFFEVWFNMLSFAQHELSLDGLRALPSVRPPSAGALFDLSAYLQLDGDELDIELVYRPDVFPADRIAVLLRHFSDVVERACRTPTSPVAALRPATAGVRGPRFAVPPAGTPVDRLHETATQDPERTAIEHAGREISYGELRQQVERAAGDLVRLGVRPGSAVALAVGRTPDLLAGMLGVLHTGAAFSVLDPGHPPRRLARQLTQLRPAVLVGPGTEPLPAELARAAAAAGVVTIVPAEPATAVPGPATGAATRLPTGAAYIAFTSGTTGQPLGVLGGVTPLTAFFDWYAERYGLAEGDRFAVLAGLSHDPLLRELLLPVWLGAAACIPDPAALATPGSTVRWLARSQVTVVHLTPPRARQLAAAAGGLTVPSARLVALGGAPVGPGDHELVRTLFPNARAISGYGATETPQAISVTDLAGQYSSAGPPMEPPLGAGSPSAELIVLRETGEIGGTDGTDGVGGARGADEVAAVNEIGEVGVRSPYLALGYLDEPVLTAARFRADPAAEPGVRLYRTGDLGRYRPDGSVELLGRSDGQLDIDGSRVEPAEIERAAREHPGVVDCVALVNRGTLMLLIQVSETGSDGTGPGGTGPDVAELTRHLAERLTPAMVPAVIVPTNRIPLTPNGKVDRARAVLAVPAASADTGPVSNRSLLDTVAGVWRQVLGIEDVPLDTPFFAAGGTSLGLLTMRGLLAQRIDRELSIGDVFQYQTVRRLAGILAAGRSGLARTASIRDRRREQVDQWRTERIQARSAARRARQDSA